MSDEPRDIEMISSPAARQSQGMIDSLLTLEALPDEVLQHIIFYISAQDILSNIRVLSRRFRDLSNQPLLWRHHCRTSFRYWDSKHEIRLKYAQSAADVDWKKLYIFRRTVDYRVSHLLDNIVQGQTNRIARFEAIAEFGYDAKDTLLRNCQVEEHAEDVLARR
jgi:F-box protein 21